MYDYAIDKFVPVRFFDYVNQKWSDHDGRPRSWKIQEGTADAGGGFDVFADRAARGWAFRRAQNGGGTIPPAAPTNVAYHRYDSRVPAAEHEEGFFDGIDVSRQRHRVAGHGRTRFLRDGLAQVAGLAAQATKPVSTGTAGRRSLRCWRMGSKPLAH